MKGFLFALAIFAFFFFSVREKNGPSAPGAGDVHAARTQAISLVRGDAGQRDVGAGLHALHVLASGGDVASDLAIAQFHLDGAHVPRNERAALESLERCVKNGSVACEGLMGELRLRAAVHLRPAGLRLLEGAAAKGDVRSAAVLAANYASGELVPRDEVLACRHAKASASGYPVSARLAGECSERGVGGDGDTSSPKDFFALAAGCGDPVAASRMAELSSSPSERSGWHLVSAMLSGVPAPSAPEPARQFALRKIADAGLCTPASH